jgi:hypothetical protein
MDGDHAILNHEDLHQTMMGCGYVSGLIGNLLSEIFKTMMKKRRTQPNGTKRYTYQNIYFSKTGI